MCALIWRPKYVTLLPSGGKYLQPCCLLAANICNLAAFWRQISATLLPSGGKYLQPCWTLAANIYNLAELWRQISVALLPSEEQYLQLCCHLAAIIFAIRQLISAPLQQSGGIHMCNLVAIRPPKYATLLLLGGQYLKYLCLLAANICKFVAVSATFFPSGNEGLQTCCHLEANICNLAAICMVANLTLTDANLANKISNFLVSWHWK